MRNKILSILEEKGEDWVVAAMVEGSIGYHSPAHARILINDIKDGRTTDACERCLAFFKGDLLAMVNHDIKGFSHVSPAKVTRLVGAVKGLEHAGPIQQISWGLMYPTAGV